MKPQTLSLGSAGRLLLFQAGVLQPLWAPGVTEASCPKAWPQRPVMGLCKVRGRACCCLGKGNWWQRKWQRVASAQRTRTFLRKQHRLVLVTI